MVRRITFRNARLAHWLSDFAATLPQNIFERGIMLYDRHRVGIITPRRMVCMQA
ncbi:hypothetical protein NBRC111894_2641 [Sporolactobacillus inulinus]|uniref:Uncharacterized protein n=1 Tax=Sporolactobacillus inulinus TaxID=2078 RepID=A0A4Y1ZDB7_9BACL|nr:hypothetical protein NBRC111894_2641 [Sporolactobacillus inulinus]